MKHRYEKLYRLDIASYMIQTMRAYLTQTPKKHENISYKGIAIAICRYTYLEWEDQILRVK